MDGAEIKRNASDLFYPDLADWLNYMTEVGEDPAPFLTADSLTTPHFSRGVDPDDKSAIDAVAPERALLSHHRLRHVAALPTLTRTQRDIARSVRLLAYAPFREEYTESGQPYDGRDVLYSVTGPEETKYLCGEWTDYAAAADEAVVRLTDPAVCPPGRYAEFMNEQLRRLIITGRED